MDLLGLGFRSTLRKLRKSFGVNDPFMSMGFETKKIRKYGKRIPEWVNDQEKIKAVFFRSFPKMQFDPKQRAQAGHWIRIITLYYKQGWTRSQIAEELGGSYCQIDSTIRNIKRAFEGLALDGRGHRKRANHACVQASYGGGVQRIKRSRNVRFRK